MGVIGWINDFIDWLLAEWNKLESWARSEISKLWSALNSKIADLKTWTNNLVSSIEQNITYVTEEIHKHYETFITNTYNTYNTYTTKITQVIGLKLSEVSQAISTAPQFLFQGVFKVIETWIDEFNRGFEKGLEE